MTIGILIVTC